MQPTNKLRWLNVPERRGTFEEVQGLMREVKLSTDFSCDYWETLHVLTKPATRTLQQWWEYPQGGAGEWQDVEEVSE